MREREERCSVCLGGERGVRRKVMIGMSESEEEVRIYIRVWISVGEWERWKGREKLREARRW